MKVLKTDSQIISLENVREVDIRETGRHCCSIVITYIDKETVFISFEKDEDPSALFDGIYRILKGLE